MLMLNQNLIKRVVPQSIFGLTRVARVLAAVSVVIGGGAPRAGWAQEQERKLVVWGNSLYGLQTDGPSAGSPGLVALSAGVNHNLALTEDGKVIAWGLDTFGQATVPSSVVDAQVKAVSAGWGHSLALTEEGKVMAWGRDQDGETQVPADLENVEVKAISAGWAHNLALTVDGAVVAWGRSRDGEGEVPAELDGVRVQAIAAGFNHSLALSEGGQVFAWGATGFGQGTVRADVALAMVSKIEAGYARSVAVTDSGDLLAWGWDNVGLSQVPSGLAGETVKQVSIGTRHTLALTESGQVVAWGENQLSQTTIPEEITAAGVKVLSIAAGGAHSMALVELPFQPLGNGASCTQDATCESGSCVDGVCCNSACGGGDPNDCQSCVGELTGEVDGTCALVNPGTACGDATTETCNAADSCNESGECLPNFAQEGTPCGDESDSVCNGADTCDGVGVCQANLAPEGSSCGDDTESECNGADTCDANGQCLDNFVAQGTSCGDASSAICDRADSCDGAGACGANMLGADDDCDDRVACTVGRCDEDGSCGVDDSGCQEICREANVWAESPDAATELIEQLDPIEVCGTRVDNLGCALEGLCTQDEAPVQDTLRQQLLAAAMNCKATNGRSDCVRSRSYELFTACNAICSGNEQGAMPACIEQLACVNAGGTWSVVVGTEPSCVVEDENCSGTPLESNAMLQAVSGTNAEACNAARETQQGLVNADTCEQLPVSTLEADLDSDGVPNTEDLCFGTPAEDVVDAQGCSVSQRCACDLSWVRGGYMDCVRAGTQALQERRKITRNEARRINSEAFQSECGLRRRSERDRIRNQLEQIPDLPDWMRELLFD